MFTVSGLHVKGFAGVFSLFELFVYLLIDRLLVRISFATWFAWWLLAGGFLVLVWFSLTFVLLCCDLLFVVCFRICLLFFCFTVLCLIVLCGVISLLLCFMMDSLCVCFFWV